MGFKVLKTLAYAHDGLNVVVFSPGAEIAEINPRVLEGLIREGFIAGGESGFIPVHIDDSATIVAVGGGAGGLAAVTTSDVQLVMGETIPETTTAMEGAAPSANESHPYDSVEIIDVWQHLEWPAMKSLASKVSEESIITKEDAKKAIEAELARRSKKA